MMCREQATEKKECYAAGIVEVRFRGSQRLPRRGGGGGSKVEGRGGGGEGGGIGGDWGERSTANPVVELFEIF